MQRAYYFCRHCHQGHFPSDIALDVADALSPAVRALATLAGTLVSFDKGSDLLQRMSGLRISTSKIRRTTCAVGEQVLQKEQAHQMVQPTPAVQWDFSLEAGGEQVVFLGIDAFSVPMQQSGGHQREHRMMYLGTFYNPEKTHTRYLVDWDLQRLAGRMRQAAVAWDLGRADRFVAITDAGNGIEGALKRAFREDLLCIVDWYHAMEYLHEHARCAFQENRDYWAWVKTHETILYEQGGGALLEDLQGDEAPTEEAAVESWEKLLRYLENQQHRMEYPQYRQEQLDIGSGPTEAGCKLMGARLKGTGMRWSEEGALQIASLRALYESGPQMWDGLWNQNRKIA